ncbi:MAG: hypothetical protein J0H31_17155, partial [Alphaproteobacteria bacterium]|nr:hypothetical protein [Alphaproteobacteria bacterium]
DDNVLVIGDGAGQQIFVPLPASVAAGDVFYATDAKALARLAKGTAGQVLQMNTGATAPQWTTLPFTKTFESTQQTITSAGALTLAHGLTVQPKLIQVCIICQTADAGYSAGDELEMNIGVAPNSGPRGISVVPDSTNLNIRFASGGSVFDVLNKSTGSTTGITLTNWKLIVRAWA